MSLLGTLGGIAGAIGGFVTGGPVGAIAGYKTGSQLGTSPNSAVTPLPSIPGIASGGLFGSGPITIPGIGTAGTIPLGFPGTAPQTGGQCPRGYHLNKHALAASKRHGALPARSICVRNRHLNPMNPRALSRALRREKRARKIVRKLHVFAPVRHQQKRLGSGRK